MKRALVLGLVLVWLELVLWLVWPPIVYYYAAAWIIGGSAFLALHRWMANYVDTWKQPRIQGASTRAQTEPSIPRARVKR